MITVRKLSIPRSLNFSPCRKLFKSANPSNRSSTLQDYLYKIQPIRHEMLTEGPTEEEKRLVTEHFSFLQGLEEKGVLVLAGRTTNTDNSSFGIVVFRANSDEEAQGIVRADPAVKNMLFRAELYPYRIALLNEENARQTHQ